MPSLNYEEIYSKFRLKAEAYDILEYRDDDVNAVFMPEYLHASINKPYIRRLFSELKLGDTVQELTYIMKYSVDDDFDALCVCHGCNCILNSHVFFNFFHNEIF